MSSFPWPVLTFSQHTDPCHNITQCRQTRVFHTCPKQCYALLFNSVRCTFMAVPRTLWWQCPGHHNIILDTWMTGSRTMQWYLGHYVVVSDKGPVGSCVHPAFFNPNMYSATPELCLIPNAFLFWPFFFMPHVPKMPSYRTSICTQFIQLIFTVTVFSQTIHRQPVCGQRNDRSTFRFLTRNLHYNDSQFRGEINYTLINFIVNIETLQVNTNYSVKIDRYISWEYIHSWDR